MASRPASAAGEVPFAALKAWVAEQEEYLQKHGRIAPLTDEQHRAIAVLVARPASPPPAPDDDDLGDTDWISLLMRYSQTHKNTHTPPKYDEEQVARPYSNSPLWRYRCQVREAPDQWFPDIPRDGSADGSRSDIGLYVRKKDARQYAARCAVKWLMANYYMPSDGKSVTFAPNAVRPQPLPPQKAQKAQGAQSAQHTQIAQKLAQAQNQPQQQPHIPPKRPFSEISLREGTPGPQDGLGQPSPPPLQSLIQLPAQAQPQPPQQLPFQPPYTMPAQIPRPELIPPPPPSQVPPQEPASPAASVSIGHRAELPSSGSSIHPPSSTSHSPPASAAPEAHVQSMASWKRPQRRGSDGTSSSSSENAHATAAAKTKATATADAGRGYDRPGLSILNSTGNRTPTPRINSNGLGLPKTKPAFSGSFEDATNVHRLETLCRVLQVGLPVYSYGDRDNGPEGIFSARITLMPSGGKHGSTTVTTLPPGVGEVQDVYTKKAAREKAAQSVLDYLQKSMVKPTPPA